MQLLVLVLLIQSVSLLSVQFVGEFIGHAHSILLLIGLNLVVHEDLLRLLFFHIRVYVVFDRVLILVDFVVLVCHLLPPVVEKYLEVLKKCIAVQSLEIRDRV